MATASKTPMASPRRSAMPPVATVYRGADGSLLHARCASRMGFQGRRAGLELDFYCLQCCEHVTLTAYMLNRLA